MSVASDFARRMASLLHDEFYQLRPLERALDIAARLIPLNGGNRARVSILRARGIQIGEETLMFDTPDFSGGDSIGTAKLSIGSHCVIDVGCSFDLGDAITIGHRVTLGQGIMILTTTHELGPAHHRAGAVVRGPVHIQDGAWLGSRSMILPGVTIGSGAIVDPGSIVNKDVAPNTRVRGTPARVVEELTP